jgi:hypothetical protein
MVIKRKLYSGTSEAILEGVTYYPSQVITDYALDPIDKTLDYVESTRIGKLEPVRKKTSRFAGVVKPLKKLLRRDKKKSGG